MYFRILNHKQYAIMAKYDMSDSTFWRDLTTKVVLVLGTVAVIVWLMPRDPDYHFRFETGKPWMNRQLFAPYEFSILKSEEAMKKERDSIINNFQPYYTYHESIEEKNVSQFLIEHKDGIPGLPLTYNKVVTDKLHEIYQRGVMVIGDNERSRGSDKLLRVIKGKNVETMSIDTVFTTKNAYKLFFADDLTEDMRASLTRCNLDNYIEPNLTYDREKSEQELNDMLSLVTTASGVVFQGQRIIERGEIVNEKTARVLKSLEAEMNRRNSSSSDMAKWLLAGQTAFVAIIVVLFTFYLQLFRKEFFEKSRSIAMLYFLIIIYPLLVFLVSKHGPFTVYALPFAMAPVFVRVFMDSRTAFMTILTIVLLCSPFVTFQYEFIIIQIVTGIVAIYSLRELSKRSQMFNTAIWVTLASVAIYYTLQYLQSNDQAKMMDQITYRDFLVSGFLLLFAYPLMLLVEKAFGFTSAVTLFELSNSNHPLMRRLSEVAPGTYQHSVMVGNLAAEIANRVGADSLLVRTGALYHDIGKLENPVFFTENQNTVNPHEKMTRQESAQILISHVTEGLRQAEKYNLPKEIKDFIRTHHGAGLTKFFYISYKNEHPDEEVDKAIFSYPGPNPFTLEQAILMMSDAVEAASRSLNEYTEESIVNLTNRIIDSLVNDGFFKDCPITFRDIAVAKQTLIGRLKSIYHTRISYPEMKKDQS